MAPLPSEGEPCHSPIQFHPQIGPDRASRLNVSGSITYPSPRQKRTTIREPQVTKRLKAMAVVGRDSHQRAAHRGEVIEQHTQVIRDGGTTVRQNLMSAEPREA